MEVLLHDRSIIRILVVHGHRADRIVFRTLHTLQWKVTPAQSSSKWYVCAGISLQCLVWCMFVGVYLVYVWCVFMCLVLYIFLVLVSATLSFTWTLQAHIHTPILVGLKVAHNAEPLLTSTLCLFCPLLGFFILGKAFMIHTGINTGMASQWHTYAHKFQC